MNEDEHFIIETENEHLLEEDQPSLANRFPVRRQLLIIGVFMFLLFAGFTIPKTIALLHSEDSDTTIQASTNLATDTQEVTPKIITDVKIYADAAFVWDVVGQRALYQKNADEPLPLASITKLMTALVAYELVTSDTPVTITKTAAAQQSGGSFTEGEVFAAKELADFALISSYNSAAYTLAATVGELLGDEDAVTQFVAAMNIRAEELNLTTLEYVNPTGLDVSATEAGAVGSARDTAFLMEYILLNHPEILTPTVTEYTRLYNQSGAFHEAYNTNDILTDIPNLLGSKTGFTDLAGGNLIIAFDAGYNRPIIVTVLGSSRNERFSDIKKLVAAVEETMSHIE